ncbi:hypothetical protein N8K70_04065 [Microbacterium betulae]|uniref:DNA-binding protein n=1 Tax=Microbacterium betulae TaxID=2981139 RepID=A0AA97I7Q0_9MICO|nr:hypothetical protein [Microbacterium sp. AB]WOF23867.1 hypothetical protein N8K70_04065 [Microbacterium sp. AB]
MSLHEFTVYLDRQPADEEFDALFDAGLDDTTPETNNGRGLLHVARDADTLASAILSVVDDIAKAGFHVVGIEDEDLVSLKTIAARLGRTPESVRLLSTGKRGPGNFPAPLTGDGWSLYSWTAVASWFAQNLGDDTAADEHTRIIAAANHLVRARALVPDLAPLAALAR